MSWRLDVALDSESAATAADCNGAHVTVNQGNQLIAMCNKDLWSPTQAKRVISHRVRCGAGVLTASHFLWSVRCVVS